MDLLKVVDAEIEEMNPQLRPTGYFLDHLWPIPLFTPGDSGADAFFWQRLPKSGVSILCVVA